MIITSKQTWTRLGELVACRVEVKTFLLGKPSKEILLQNSEMWMEGLYRLIHIIHLTFHMCRHGAA